MGYGEVGGGGSLQWTMVHKHPRYDPAGLNLHNLPERVHHYDVDTGPDEKTMVTIQVKGVKGDYLGYDSARGIHTIRVPLGYDRQLIRIHWPPFDGVTPEPDPEPRGGSGA